MLKKSSFVVILVAVVLVFLGMVSDSDASAQNTLNYSRSAQVSEAFGKEALDAFTKESGIKVKSHVSSSASAVYRLMNGFSDIASTTRELYRRHRDYGYVQIPFCKDPIAILTNAKNPVGDISESQLQEIFSGDITNWKDVGGPDQPIVVVVPGEDTGAYKNFARQVMKRKEVAYDLMTYRSTMAIDVVEHFPWSISAIAQGAAVDHKAVKVLKIDGRLPRDSDYPYQQIFYFITKGEPAGPAKALIDFVFSEKGIEIIKKKGMVPVLQ